MPNAQFDSVVDTQRIFPGNGGYGLRHDSCFLDWAAGYGSDYRIVFPSTGSVYAISHLKLSGHTFEDAPSNCGKGIGGFCTDQLLSYTINNVDYIAANINGGRYIIIK